MGRGPEPNLGIGEIAVRLAKLAHGFARERVIEVDHEKLIRRVVGSEHLAAPLLMLHAEEHVLGSRALAEVVRGPIMATTSPTGSPPSGLALGAPGLTPSAPSREMGCSAKCACVWTSRCSLQCHRA